MAKRPARSAAADGFARLAAGGTRRATFTMYFAHATLDGNIVSQSLVPSQFELLAGEGELRFTRGTAAARGYHGRISYQGRTLTTGAVHGSYDGELTAPRR